MKLNQIISLLTLLSLLVPYLSFAQFPPPESFPPPEIPTSFFGCLPSDTLRVCILKILDKILKVILVLALSFAAIMIAIAGITYITKGSDADAQKKAQSRIIYAAVGLVVAFLSWVMTVILERIIRGGPSSI
jgi:hypothetical protein